MLCKHLWPSCGCRTLKKNIHTQHSYLRLDITGNPRFFRICRISVFFDGNKYRPCQRYGVPTKKRCEANENYRGNLLTWQPRSLERQMTDVKAPTQLGGSEAGVNSSHWSARIKGSGTRRCRNDLCRFHWITAKMTKLDGTTTKNRSKLLAWSLVFASGSLKNRLQTYDE